MRISDWSSDVCSSDLLPRPGSNMGTGVSSVWIFEAVRPTSRMRLMIGSSSTDACPTHPASVERSISIPCAAIIRSEEHTSELQSLMRISYAVFCLKKKKLHTNNDNNHTQHNRRQ